MPNHPNPMLKSVARPVFNAWGQCYKAFFLSTVTPHQNKLERLSLENIFSLDVYKYLIRVERCKVHHGCVLLPY